ncbi:peptidylprolyl isomerase [Histidinibacterium aquaticum]|uniref:Parvulin-like PPIase n=1 Tax=Histidinibacterium aquaticum TaxID=2613962 RepID=A0A5J5GMF6_9RHOB|nr:peptidylprolyl isomerase [Histidinibacterium aquaticum]KAA9009375.1 peptidylprolyl isomerase [Histidinibacterium aquaticum]
MTPLRILAACIALWTPALPALAQSQFSPVITVNGDAVTAYELQQRIRLLELFETPGDLPELAREQLIEDRLKLQELRRAGLRITEEALAGELENFAARTDLPYEQFLGLLAQNGIAEETLRDFVEVGVSWRDYIRSRYQSQVNVTDRDVDFAVADLGGTGSQIEVLLSEIIIPAPPPRAAEANAIAARISNYTTTSAFEAAAREYSALPSRERGGRLDWVPIDNYPAQIRQILLDLTPGEVTQPLPIQNGVALFQLRAVREVRDTVPPPALIDYALLYLPGGGTEAGLAEAARIDARVDTCDDLYGVARGLPEEQLVREELPPAQIPRDIALELAKLDFNEASYALSRGDTRLFLMLCSRTPEVEGGLDREAVASSLRSQRLSSYADRLLAELEAAATIRGAQ